MTPTGPPAGVRVPKPRRDETLPVIPWACPRHPRRRAAGPGLCSCGRARIPVRDIRAPEEEPREV